MGVDRWQGIGRQEILHGSLPGVQGPFANSFMRSTSIRLRMGVLEPSFFSLFSV